ncbi:hypothetical protein AVEN_172811-1 [Araneus ventricosus]|uniref:Zinc finger PHD-type domain-containing protein n=1 Tax=Araneus ventricosus TaxID=182803 RepID=A0A4Y2BKY5_ARAVE|nr:hypothetical protein AVEN_172811-1 [Araneus ventricosus]
MELKSEEEEREGGEETHCITCAETFEEDWIQCRICEGWVHENHADLEGNKLFYECDAPTHLYCPHVSRHHVIEADDYKRTVDHLNRRIFYVLRYERSVHAVMTD